MGIHGLLAQIGPGERTSLAKLSAQYFVKNERPFRLAIDISIWLFQIQSGKGGSNPALRTFYYRLLRLLSLNIHPLFVFDGPNKPLFKRNKKVGGPGVRVASVPEFLAKQLLKQFGFPWHVAPGEAEAECALLQREGIVDAVLSEDVDTMMFGSGVTLRNWTAENTTKTPTHVDLHRAELTKARSGMDREGMILVALMSGGDYLPEGIPGCGPKSACDAARAGFGKDLCALGRSDRAGLADWKERLTHEMRTNESRFFSRKNKQFTIPDEFPSREVLGFYTHPCVSTPEKLDRLRRELRWDQPIDFAALRTFTGDAFDWRCIGGAKKFIKNLAPALLVRELRLEGVSEQPLDIEQQEAREQQYVQAIHGKRNHRITDGELEYRISFVPEKLVPIDLSIEDEDDEIIPAGSAAEDASDVESEIIVFSADARDEEEDEAPASPKKRNFKPYDPSKPEKLWLLRPFLQVGCPLLIEEYEASMKDPKEFLKQRRKARAAAKNETNMPAAQARPKKEAKANDMATNSLMAYAKVTKAVDRPSAKDNSSAGDAFRLPATQIPVELLQSQGEQLQNTSAVEVLDLAVITPKKRSTETQRPVRPFAPFLADRDTKDRPLKVTQSTRDPNRTPRKATKKRTSADISSPVCSQRTITSFYTPTPRKTRDALPAATQDEVVNLISSPSVPLFGTQRPPLSPTPPNIRYTSRRTSASPPPAQLDFSPGKLPDTVTKRRKKSPLKRWRTEPAFRSDGVVDFFDEDQRRPDTAALDNCAVKCTPRGILTADVIDICDTSPAQDDEELASPSAFVPRRVRSTDLDGGFVREDEELDATPKPPRQASTRVEPPDKDPLPPPSPSLIQAEVNVTLGSDNRKADDDLPPIAHLHQAPLEATSKRPTPLKAKQSTARPSLQQSRRSPRQAAKKKRIQLRESLEGAWRETEIEAVDMTGDGSGWKASGRKATITGWRKSGVEVLDLTGA